MLEWLWSEGQGLMHTWCKVAWSSHGECIHDPWFFGRDSIFLISHLASETFVWSSVCNRLQGLTVSGVVVRKTSYMFDFRIWWR